MGILSIAICFFKHRSVSRSKHFFCIACVYFFFNQKTAYEVRISDWSSDVCSSDLLPIGTETTRPCPTLVRLDCFPLERCIITKVGHPLLKVKQLSLHDIARYPIITRDPSFSGRWKVLDAFTQAGVTPKIIFGAVDADVGKTYRSEERRVGKEGASTCRYR